MAISKEIGDEDAARAYFERVRWPDGPVCPHCGEKNRAYTIKPKRGSKTRKGLYKCGSCRKQFTVTVGTIMHRSHIPLHKWILAIHLMCSSKKGISALQLQRELDLKSYKSAWHMCHRIRLAMKQEPMASTLGGDGGTVEIDETYVGGKPRKGDGKVHKRGRGTKKTPVLALIERNGNAHAEPLERVDGKHLKQAISEHVHGSARIMTDELNAYRKATAGHAHHTVNHSAGEYSRGDDHINTAESFFSLIKRGHKGAFHQMSKHHLHRYCDEFVFRWNHRKDDDDKRREAAIRGVGGKRLTFREPVERVVEAQE